VRAEGQHRPRREHRRRGQRRKPDDPPQAGATGGVGVSRSALSGLLATVLRLRRGVRRPWMLALQAPHEQQTQDVQDQESRGPPTRDPNARQQAVAGRDAGCGNRQHHDHERSLQQHHRVLDIDRKRLLADRKIRDSHHDHRDRNAAEQAVDCQVHIAQGGCNGGEAHLRQRAGYAQQRRADERLPQPGPVRDDLAVAREAVTGDPHRRAGDDEGYEGASEPDRMEVQPRHRALPALGRITQPRR
jgi:hypothetical protein